MGGAIFDWTDGDERGATTGGGVPLVFSCMV
jgi:hypothetical protein